MRELSIGYRHGRENGVRGVMDFLAEEPSGGAGTGRPELKRETRDWLSQYSVRESQRIAHNRGASGCCQQ